MPFIFAVPKNIFRLVEERILFGVACSEDIWL